MLRRLSLALVLSAAVPCLIAPAPAWSSPGAGKQPAPAPAPAKDGPGTSAVKQANTTIANLLKQRPAPGSKEERDLARQVTASVRSFLDIDQLGRRAMVDQWTRLSKAQQDQFLALLRDLIENNYVRGLRANLAYTVLYTGESADREGNVNVATKINTQRKGRPFSIAIEYVLVKEGDKLRAFDIKTDGVGLVENYRTTFNKIVERDGFDGLLSRMKKKLSEAQAEPAKG